MNDNIRNIREDRNFTQSQVAEALHISQRAYSHYGNGTRALPVSVLVDLARFYEVSADYLLGLIPN